MQFFNFTNEETFHFFEWVTRGKQVDPEALIADAYRDAENDREGALIGEAMGICYLVRDHLADRLADVLEETLPLEFRIDDGFYQAGAVQEDEESLWQPLLALAAGGVNYSLVAQALLARAGKWSPEKEFPEIH
jgi:hypothetical protein